MANLFAQATANWTAANEWNTVANGSGSFVTPGASDVCMANGFDVTITANVTVAEIRNDTTGGATAGGRFICSTNGATVTANVYAGGVLPTSNGCFQCAHAAGSTVNLVGNATGGSVGNAAGARNGSTGTLNITGTVTGGSALTSYGLSNASTGTVNITGNATGGAGATAHGAFNSTTGTLNVTGNAIAHASGGANGANNVAGGTMTISGYALANDYGPGSSGITAAAGANNAAQGVLEVGEVRSGSRGLGGVSGARRFISTTAATMKHVATSGNTAITLRSVAGVVPAASDVKSGVTYGDGAYTGTLSGVSGRTSMNSAMG